MTTSRQRNRTLYIMMTPAILVMFLVIIFPLIDLIYQSTLNWQLTKPWAIKFVGLQNYVKLFQDKSFFHSLFITGLFVFGAVALQLALALVMAEILNIAFRFRNLVQSFLIMPMIIAPVVVGVIWKLLYHPSLGLINYYLGKLVGLQFSWLGNQELALLSLVISDVWQWTPFVLIIFLASYAAVPVELYEAAEVDGSTRWQKFIYITIPQIFPMIIFATLFRITEAFKVFPKIFIMTMGGPSFSTETLNFYTYRQAFTYSNIGYSSTLGVAMFAFSLIVVAIMYYLMKKYHS